MSSYDLQSALGFVWSIEFEGRLSPNLQKVQVKSTHAPMHSLLDQQVSERPLGSRPWLTVAVDASQLLWGQKGLLHLLPWITAYVILTRIFKVVVIICCSENILVVAITFLLTTQIGISTKRVMSESATLCVRDSAWMTQENLQIQSCSWSMVVDDTVVGSSDSTARPPCIASLWHRYRCILYAPKVLYCFLHSPMPQVTRKWGSWECTYPMCLTSAKVFPANEEHMKQGSLDCTCETAMAQSSFPSLVITSANLLS